MQNFITTVIGARPQFIKAAAVSRALKSAGVYEKIIHTGQHFDQKMSEIFFREMEIPRPHYQLDIHSLPHGAMTGRMLEEIEKILMQDRPNAVLVYGDTNSTLAGALAAIKLHIPVIHVEAGLRSFDMKMPEEVNRILTDRLSSLLFCPTATSVENLYKEGFQHFDTEIIHCGDVMYDAVLYYLEKAKKSSTIIEKLHLKEKEFALATIHRQENTDDIDRLEQIVKGLNLVNEELLVVVPLHPRTTAHLQKINTKPEFKIIEPVGYFDMIVLLEHCKLVLTDSGGLQKEAYFFSKPCVTLREQTEWTELVASGCNHLAGYKAEEIFKKYVQSMSKEGDFNGKLYGDGHSTEIIAEKIKRKFM